jgi:ABC-type Co2+ transport system permease subunit
MHVPLLIGTLPVEHGLLAIILLNMNRMAMIGQNMESNFYPIYQNDWARRVLATLT